MVLSRGHIIPRQHPVLFLSRRRNMVTELTCSAAHMDVNLSIKQPWHTKYCHLKFRIQIKVLITQRTTCLHLQRSMLSKPVSPGSVNTQKYEKNPEADPGRMNPICDTFIL